MGKSRVRSLFKKLRKDEESQSPPPQRDPATPPSNSVATISIPSANSGTSQASLPVELFQPQDLWTIAFDKLDAEQQAILSEVKPQTKSRDQQCPIETKNVVDEVVDLTTERYRQFQIKASGRFHKSSRRILDAALSFKEVIGAAAGLDPTQHAASVWAMVSLGLTMTENYHDRQDALFESSDYLADTLAQCAFIEQKYYRTPNSFDPENVGDTLVRLYLALLRYTVQVQKELAASRAKRLWDCVSAMVDIPLTELKDSIERALEGLDRRIVRDQHLKRGEQAEMILSEIDKLAEYLKQFTEQLAIANLPIAETASYDSYANQNEEFCLQGTREELLREISQWAESRDEFMFCLKGMAGTGKSTVARTIARDLQSRGLLGATFFFKRGDADRGDGRLFMSTIARLLAIRYPEISPGILEAVKKDGQISSRHLSEQFDKLLYQPLLGFRPEILPTIVIIIDALDECDRRDNIFVILKHLFRLQGIPTIRLRILLTTRPEFDIETEVNKNSNRRDLVLNELPLPVIEHDIELFLKYKFSVLRIKESLDPDWPGANQIERLVRMASPLFIFAATICRFISDQTFDPEQRLREFLDQPATASEDQMDRTYLPVLNQLVVGYSTRDAEKQKQRFLEIVGVIILLADPLSLTALSQLINIPAKDVDRGLRCFHSVLAVPKDYTTPICTLHTSFRDFLITTDSIFQVNEQETHGKLASHCLRVMMSGLKHNICGLASYGTKLEDIDQQTIDQRLHPELQYACHFWVHHLQRSKGHVSESDILSFFEKHFLHWLEALALMRRLSEAIGMIDILKSATTVSGRLSRSWFEHRANIPFRFMLIHNFHGS
ncbi:unnamed protein product [Penicillium olsonii]|uniref:NACHT domain-containing protein n=1 Tax=Penicillium olsonii TaxID=99116 RepID=A0A9W4HST3_PENOL|nr:unnamed protein product [Penicillium olsonii]CAG8303509.1 unnamed protein product [Penicillium olsonii]